MSKLNDKEYIESIKKSLLIKIPKTNKFTLDLPISASIIRIFPPTEKHPEEYEVFYLYDSKDTETNKRHFIMIDENDLKNPRKKVVPVPHVRRFGRNIFEIDPEIYDDCQIYIELSKMYPFVDGVESALYIQFLRLKPQIVKFNKDQKKSPYVEGQLSQEFLDTLK